MPTAPVVPQPKPPIAPGPKHHPKMPKPPIAPKPSSGGAEAGFRMCMDLDDSACDLMQNLCRIPELQAREPLCGMLKAGGCPSEMKDWNVSGSLCLSMKTPLCEMIGQRCAADPAMCQSPIVQGILQGLCPHA